MSAECGPRDGAVDSVSKTAELFGAPSQLTQRTLKTMGHDLCQAEGNERVAKK